MTVKSQGDIDASGGLSTPHGPASEFWSGVVAAAPLLFGVVPFGMIFGVLGLTAGLPAWAVMSLCVIMFAGSSQIVFAQLWAAQVPPILITATVTVVNLRHALYSASVSQFLRDLPLRWKLLLAYLLTDEAYAVSIARLSDGPATPHRHWFLFGAGGTLWSAWQLSVLSGVLLGPAIPPSWSLDFSIALTFIALVVPSLRHRSEILSALTAASIALIAQALPHKLWIIVAALAGMAVGALTRALDPRSAARSAP